MDFVLNLVPVLRMVQGSKAGEIRESPGPLARGSSPWPMQQFSGRHRMRLAALPVLLAGLVLPVPSHALDVSGGVSNVQGGKALAAAVDGAKSVLDYVPTHMHVAIRAGTGTEDLTAYLSAALNDRANTVLRFPEGLYNSTGLTVTRTNLIVFAYGAHIRNKHEHRSAVLRVVAPASNVSILGGDWEGSGQQAYSKALPNGYEGGGVYFGGVSDVSIQDAYVHEAMTVGIGFEGVTRARARNNTVARVYIGPGVGTSYSNFGIYTGNTVRETAAESITVDNTSHDNIVQGNHLSDAGYQLGGQTLPTGVTVGCFGGIGAGASANDNIFDSNIIRNTSCAGIGFSGRNNRITNNIISRVAGHGIHEQYYSGVTANGTGHITSDQGGNLISGNAFTDIGSGFGIVLEHDTSANVIGPNNTNGFRVADQTNGAQGNVFVNESGTALVHSQASAALTASVFGKYVQIKGSSDWRTTLPLADQQAGGRIEIFCNATVQTIRSPSGIFGGPYGGASTKACPPNGTLTFRSDGYNWQITHSSSN